MSKLSIHKNNINFIYYGSTAPLTTKKTLLSTFTMLDSKVTRSEPGRGRERNEKSIIYFLYFCCRFLSVHVAKRRRKFPPKQWCSSDGRIKHIKWFKSPQSCVMFCSTVSLRSFFHFRKITLYKISFALPSDVLRCLGSRGFILSRRTVVWGDYVRTRQKISLDWQKSFLQYKRSSLLDLK